MNKIKIIKSFNLSEVLITLAIIGVVAAITIPIINNATWTKEQKEDFKHALSIVSQATLQVRADQGYDMQCYYNDPGGAVTTECSAFWTNFKSKLNIVKSCANNSLANGCIPNYKQDYVVPGGCGGFSDISNTNPSFVLTDGTIIIPYTSTHPLFLIDINGSKKPNRIGQDVFEWRLVNKNGAVKVTDYWCVTSASDGKTSAQMFQYAFQ